MELAIERYQNQHQHIINRLIHVVCIPAIAFTFIAGGRMIPISDTITLSDLISLLYIRMYYDYDQKTLIPMILFFGMSNIWATIMINTDPDCILHLVSIHCLAWLFQFVGHYGFEGNRPLLFESINDSITAAPLLVYKELSQCFQR